MKFETLEDRMNYYRGMTDYKLMPGSYVLIMLDGRSFSKKIKKAFSLPFDDDFIDIMNQTAQHLCKNIEGCKFAYVQSDEISLIVTDFDTPTTDSWFGYRLSKILSISASLATSKFNQLMSIRKLKSHVYINPDEAISEMPLYEFDCKAWNVPSENDVFAWFLHRQLDCIRNSKQQASQTYLPKKSLLNLTTDQQCDLLKDTHGISWSEYKEGEKYGRFIWKVQEQRVHPDTGEEYFRSVWQVNDAWPLYEESGKVKWMDLGILI